eukprot:365389-Chlamydomonas_euryale.AAC.2
MKTVSKPFSSALTCTVVAQYMNVLNRVDCHAVANSESQSQREPLQRTRMFGPQSCGGPAGAHSTPPTPAVSPTCPLPPWFTFFLQLPCTRSRACACSHARPCFMAGPQDKPQTLMVALPSTLTKVDLDLDLGPILMAKMSGP